MTPDTAPKQPAQQGGVLATLPRTRPQRPSARRAAARRKAESETTVTAPAKPAKKTSRARVPAKTKTTIRGRQSTTEPAATARGHARANAPQSKQPTAEPVTAPRAHARASRRDNKQPATGPVTAAPATAHRTRAKAKAKTASKAGAKPKPRLTAVKPPEPAVPKQGYEPEEEVELGKPVSPPSGLELVESLVAVAGELAGGSLSAGGRLLKDALSSLRRP